MERLSGREGASSNREIETPNVSSHMPCVGDSGHLSDETEQRAPQVLKEKLMNDTEKF